MRGAAGAYFSPSQGLHVLAMPNPLLAAETPHSWRKLDLHGAARRGRSILQPLSWQLHASPVSPINIKPQLWGEQGDLVWNCWVAILCFKRGTVVAVHGTSKACLFLGSTTPWEVVFRRMDRLSYREGGRGHWK